MNLFTPFVKMNWAAYVTVANVRVPNLPCYTATNIKDSTVVIPR